MTAFDHACSWLENDIEIHSAPEFASKVKEFSESNESYSTVHIKRLLEKKYGEFISVSPISKGKEGIIKFQNTAKFFIENRYKHDKKASVTEEKQRMVTIVGSLIRSEICNKQPGEFYPSPHDLSNIDYPNEWVPPTLQTLLDVVLTSKVKQTAIGHAITSACKPKLVSPLLFGLGIELDHCFGSKWLNNHLARLVFSITNDEVRRFRQTLMERDSMLPEIPPNSFVQYSADNVDHNSRTLDGKNTFHGMGVIACVTLAVSISRIPVTRTLSRKPLPDISTVKEITIIGYFGKAVPSKSLKFEPYSSLTEVIKSDEKNGPLLDLVWLSNWKTSSKRK